jgi:hypothetical protein
MFIPLIILKSLILSGLADDLSGYWAMIGYGVQYGGLESSSAITSIQKVQE